MVAWSGIGMNYGHSYTTGNYSTTQVESDLTFLSTIGINKVRIAGPNFGGPMTANCQDMVTRALSHGFYVVWGVATGASRPNLNATTWASCKSYVTGTLAPWAQANGLSELMLCNEADWEVDGSTLTAATVQSDIRSMVTTVKSGGYSGNVSYCTATGMLANWISGGIGALDRIGWNSYDILTVFQSNATSIMSNFGALSYISEFGCKQFGFPDYNDESVWYTDVVNRVSILKSTGIPSGYFFTYRDGGFGLTPDTYALVLSTGAVRSARDAIKNVIAPQFSAFGVHV